MHICNECGGLARDAAVIPGTGEQGTPFVAYVFCSECGFRGPKTEHHSQDDAKRLAGHAWNEALDVQNRLAMFA